MVSGPRKWTMSPYSRHAFMNAWTLSRWISRMLPRIGLPRGPGIGRPFAVVVASAVAVICSSQSECEAGDIGGLERRDRFGGAAVGEDLARGIDPGKDHPERRR